MKKIKKSIYLVIIMLLGVVGLTTYAVTAWLTDTDTSGPQTFTVGDVEFALSGAATTVTPVVPGQELVATKYTLTNASTVSTELRVKITIVTSYPSVDEDAKSLVLMTLGSNWGTETDGYYYYSVSSNPIIVAGTQALDFLTSLKLDGSKVGNPYTAATFTVTIMFEAKQADYVTWTELGSASIDFTTGIPAV
ncbi:MAG: hypothetical protein PHY42_02600 [Bacilli bacterium]|nr:hypothetical protein [Bacilli bacterium]